MNQAFKIEQALSSSDDMTADVRAFKKKFQYFPTPDKVLERMSEEFHIAGGFNVLEPEAGKGYVCRWLKENFANFESNPWTIDACEINEGFHPELEQHANIIGADFLALEPGEKQFNFN